MINSCQSVLMPLSITIWRLDCGFYGHWFRLRGRACKTDCTMVGHVENYTDHFYSNINNCEYYRDQQFSSYVKMKGALSMKHLNGKPLKKPPYNKGLV